MECLVSMMMPQSGFYRKPVHDNRPMACCFRPICMSFSVSVCSKPAVVLFSGHSGFQAFKWALLFLFFLLFPTFLICSYFSMKMPYYPYFFTLKCHLCVKIQNFFLARFAPSDIWVNFYAHSGSTPLNTSIFNV